MQATRTRWNTDAIGDPLQSFYCPACGCGAHQSAECLSVVHRLNTVRHSDGSVEAMDGEYGDTLAVLSATCAACKLEYGPRAKPRVITPDDVIRAVNDRVRWEKGEAEKHHAYERAVSAHAAR